MIVMVLIGCMRETGGEGGRHAHTHLTDTGGRAVSVLWQGETGMAALVAENPPAHPVMGQAYMISCMYQACKCVRMGVCVTPPLLSHPLVSGILLWCACVEHSPYMLRSR